MATDDRRDGEPTRPSVPQDPGGALDVPATRSPVPPPRPGEPEILARYRPVRPAPPPFLAWWARPSTIVLVAVVVFVLLVTTTVFATLAISGGSAPTPAAAPTPDPSSPSPSGTTVPPSRMTDMPGISTAAVPPSPGGPTAADGSPAAGGIDLPLAPVGAARPWQSGTHEEQYPRSYRGFDFDGNDDNVSADGYRTDIAITDYGLTGVNGVAMARFRGKGRPQVTECTTISADNWVLDWPARELKAGVTLCYYTSNDRYGYLTVLDARQTNGGLLGSVTFNFLVWAGPYD
jgi:hypothetical protein